MRKTILSLLFITSLLAFPVAAFNLSSAANFLKSQTVDDWSVMGLAAANALSGVNVDFLKTDPGAKPTDIEKRILAMVAAGRDPETFGSSNLITNLAANFNGTEIESPLAASILNDDIFGLLALAAADKQSLIQSKLAAFLKENQSSDGGFSHYKAPAGSNTDATSMAIMALLASGESANSQTIAKAFEFLASTKTSAGYSHLPGGAADPFSTSWAIAANRAAGKSVPPEAMNFLNGFQRSNGSLDDSALLTSYGLVAQTAFFPVKGTAGGGGALQTFTFPVQIIGPEGQIFQNSVTVNQNTALASLTEAGRSGGFSVITKSSALGLFVENVAGFGPNGDHGWLYAVNGTKPGISASQFPLQNNDRIIWFYGGPNDPVPTTGVGGGDTGGGTPASVNLSANIISPSPVELSLSSSRLSVQLGETVVLAWSSRNAAGNITSAPDNWAQNLGSGEKTVQPSRTTTYRIATTAANGAIVEKEITITVDTAPAVVFGVDIASVDFGDLKPGDVSSARTARLSNNGTANLRVTAALSNADSLYQQGLFLGSDSWQNYETELESNLGRTINMSLRVPANFSGTGRKTGTLIFWAQPR